MAGNCEEYCRQGNSQKVLCAAPPEQFGLSVSNLGEFIQYSCAVAVGEELHFTRAASRLHLDQSAVSRHIQRLESTFAVKLFIRGSRGVELTEAGRAFVERARRVLLAATDAAAVAKTIGQGERGRLEITYSTLVDVRVIARVKTLIEYSGPRIPVRFESVQPEMLAKRVLDGSTTIGIGLLPVEEDVAQVSLVEEQLFAAVPVLHDLARRREIRLSELSHDAVIWPFGPLNSAFSRELMRLFAKQGYQPALANEAKSVAEALASAQEGFGITFVKASDARLSPAGLVMLPIADGSISIRTGLVYLEEQRWDVLRDFVTQVTAALSPRKPPGRTTIGSSNQHGCVASM